MTTKADTCRTYELPKLLAADWTEEQIHHLQKVIGKSIVESQLFFATKTAQAFWTCAVIAV